MKPLQITTVMRNFENGHFGAPWSGTPTLPNNGPGLAMREYALQAGHAISIPFAAIAGDSVYKFINELEKNETLTEFVATFSTGQNGAGTVLGTYQGRATGTDQPFAQDIDRKTTPGTLYWLTIFANDDNAHKILLGVSHYGGVAH